MSSQRGFPRRSIAWGAVPILAMSAATIPARAQRSAAGYVLLVASGVLCDASDAFTCPAVVKSAQGDRYEMSGAGTVNSPLCAPFCGTIAYANNDLGVIVGSLTDANIVPHGFLREPNGHITSFDAPGAGLGAGLNQGTAAYAITDHGAIVGQYQDSNYVYHGFVRYPDGFFDTFDAPEAGTGANQGTLAWDINRAGITAGTYIDGSGVNHGFLRSA